MTRLITPGSAETGTHHRLSSIEQVSPDIRDVPPRLLRPHLEPTPWKPRGQVSQRGEGLDRKVSRAQDRLSYVHHLLQHLAVLVIAPVDLYPIDGPRKDSRNRAVGEVVSMTSS